MIRFKFLSKSQAFVPDGRKYYVKAAKKPAINMVFGTRAQARSYKHMLKNSLQNLDSVIIAQEFKNGIQTEDRQIS